MVFKHFRFLVILRVLGILVSSLALMWSIYETDFLMTPIVFGLFTVIQVLALISFMERSTRQLNSFMESFVDQDYTRKFESQYEGKVFRELSQTFNRILDEYARLSVEREGQYQYVKQINEHVQVALISFKDDGRIDLMNKRAQQLLNSPLLYRIEDLSHYEVGLKNLILRLGSGERELYKTAQLSLAVVAKKFSLAKEQFTLVAIQDISKELEANELESWQKLIRVLTHEIMNSMTPVLSLSTAVKKLVEEENSLIAKEKVSPEDILDIHKSIKAIEKRGEGLLKFVNAYRDYTKIPELELEKVSFKALMDEVLTLFDEQIQEKKIAVSCDCEFDARLALDSKLITQVLINLLKNAIEALEKVDNPKIELSLKGRDEQVSFTISDNGSGIPEEIRNDIFVPFFTTKKEGSGIGLSLSRQIIKAHGGDLSLISTTHGCSFELILH